MALTRSSKGKFADGNEGGPGRPRRETERSYIATLSEACPPSVWREVVERAVADAKAGDPKAREWLASYLCGKPNANAPMLKTMAAEEVAGVDPLADDIMIQMLGH